MIIISPYSKKMRDDPKKINPKHYPFWTDLIQKLENDYKIIQVGVEEEVKLVDDFRRNLSLVALKGLIKQCDFWISIDNFFPHLAHHVDKPHVPGVVLFGPSNPKIYGYPENLNLYKDEKYFVSNQFGIWESTPANPDMFPKANIVYDEIKKFVNKLNK